MWLALSPAVVHHRWPPARAFVSYMSRKEQQRHITDLPIVTDDTEMEEMQQNYRFFTTFTFPRVGFKTPATVSPLPPLTARPNQRRGGSRV